MVLILSVSCYQEETLCIKAELAAVLKNIDSISDNVRFSIAHSVLFVFKTWSLAAGEVRKHWENEK